MIPMAPTSILAIPPSSKPKIGFSIDSIVGNNALNERSQDCNSSPRSESPDRPSSSLSDYNYPLELRNNDHLPKDYRIAGDQQSNHQTDIRSSRIHQHNMMLSHDFQNKFFSFPESPTCHDILVSHHNKSANVHNSSSPVSVQRSVSPDDSVKNMTRTPSSSPSSIHHQHSSKGPIVVPGIPAGLIRPFPVQPSNLSEIKTLPPYLNSPEIVGSTNPHFLAAHFQMAAAMAHGQNGQGFPPVTGLSQHHPQFSNPNMVRDSYPLYPWLLSRHGRIFPHRFPGNFLLQPFRKPKRVRTAFSPTQLLKLEHAFEGNHYVVGAERKTLAQALSLTEIQVKVWFQNRRTKHKRMQQEEDTKSGHGDQQQKNNNKDNNNGGKSSSQASYDDDDDDCNDDDDESEDELIDMDDCPSDQECDLVP